MRRLPTEKDQHWLLVSMADLIRAQGYEHFLSYPIVEPTPQFFPERWSFSHKGLDRVTRRLMQYAGLGDLDVATQVFSDGEELRSGLDERRRDSTAGLFLGIEDGRCLFGFNVESPADAEYMAGVMCHEVAHAYRAYHELVLQDTREEELLTDLTCCYLGFGILVANNSYRYRTSGELVGNLAYTHWSSHQTGYISPQGLCYLLGLQLVVRDADPKQRRRVFKHLESNQAAFASAAYSECQSRSQDFPEVLGIPPFSERHDIKSLRSILLPLPDFDEPEIVEPQTQVPGENRGRPVFRVRRTKAMLYGLLGVMMAGAAGVILSIPLGALGLLLVIMMAIIGLCGGLFVGSHRLFDVCSDPDCSSIIPPEADTCPACEGIIMGRIRSQSDRLDAEERLEEQAELSGDDT